MLRESLRLSADATPHASARQVCKKAYLGCPLVAGVWVGGTVVAGGIVAGGGGTVVGAIPVVAGGPASLLAVLFVFALVKTSASTMMMNTAPAIHPQGVGLPTLESISSRRFMSILRSKSRGSVMALSPNLLPIWRYLPI
jgi:hypothetical protein